MQDATGSGRRAGRRGAMDGVFTGLIQTTAPLALATRLTYHMRVRLPEGGQPGRG